MTDDKKSFSKQLPALFKKWWGQTAIDDGILTPEEVKSWRNYAEMAASAIPDNSSARPIGVSDEEWRNHLLKKRLARTRQHDPDAVAVLCGQCKKNYVHVKFTHGNIDQSGYSVLPCEECAPNQQQTAYVTYGNLDLTGQRLATVHLHNDSTTSMVCGFCRKETIRISGTSNTYKKHLDRLGYCTMPCRDCKNIIDARQQTKFRPHYP